MNTNPAIVELIARIARNRAEHKAIDRTQGAWSVVQEKESTDEHNDLRDALETLQAVAG